MSPTHLMIPHPSTMSPTYQVYHTHKLGHPIIQYVTYSPILLPTTLACYLFINNITHIFVVPPSHLLCHSLIYCIKDSSIITTTQQLYQSLSMCANYISILSTSLSSLSFTQNLFHQLILFHLIFYCVIHTYWVYQLLIICATHFLIICPIHLIYQSHLWCFI